MKKLLLFVVLIAVILVLLPLIGNKIAQEEIQNRLDVLSSYGVNIDQSSSQSNYVSTTNHYEFSIADSEKFIAYLNQFADNQIPPYIDALFEGVVVGVDLKYSNFPLSDCVSVDIYPLNLSKSLVDALEQNDKHLSQYLDALLKSKGVLYHLEYHVASNDFNGYIKDIDEKLKLEKGITVEVLLHNVTYEGEGPLIAPTRLQTKSGAISFKAYDDNVNVNFEIADMTSDAAFESDTTYLSQMFAKKIYFSLKDTMSENVLFDIKDFQFVLGSDTKAQKAEANAKMSANKIDFKAEKMMIATKEFHYDIRVSDMDKDSYKALSEVVKKAQRDTGSMNEEEITQSIMNLLSKGLILEVQDLSVKSVTLKEHDYRGASLQSKIVFKANPNFANNINRAPLAAANDIGVNATLKISKELFSYINKQLPMSTMALSYAKEEGEDYVYQLVFENKNLTINGKSL